MNKTLGVAAVLLAATHANAGEGLKEMIGRLYPGARIVLTGVPKRIDTGAELSMAEAKAPIEGLNDTGKGEARFRAGEIQAVVPFRALVPAWLAVKRVHPGEKLSASQFIQQEVNVAAGMEHEIRGIILGADNKLEGLESRQSILEGQFATTPAVQRMPDVRKGESVRVLLIAGGVTLSTTGTAEEPAFIDGSLKITALKTKRLLVGKLVSPGTVEVSL